MKRLLLLLCVVLWVGTSTTLLASTATSGSDIITITGAPQSTTANTCPNNYPYYCPQTVYNMGTVRVTINGTTYSNDNSYASTVTTVASGLATAINGGTLATATASGGTITVTARATGAGTNYVVTTSCQYSQYFSSCNFQASAGNFTGGRNASSISLAIAPNPSTYGTSVTLSASATSGATGSVQFMDGATTLGSPVSLSGSSATYSTGTLAAGTHSITAVYSGDSTYGSATSSAITQSVSSAAQAISFTAPSSPVTFGVSPISLSATGGGSGNWVTFSVVSGPGSISGNTLTVTGAGTVVVAANQSGNTNYNAAPQVLQSVVVNPCPQTINFSPPLSPVVYGVSPIALSATGGGSGNPVTFNVVSGPGSINGTTLTITGAGTVLVAANQSGNGNYTAATPSTQSVVVNQASQAISFTPPSSPVSYGVSPIGLLATGGNSGNAIAFSVLSGPGTISGTTLTISGVGTVVVVANQSANTNYAAAPQVTRSVTVNAATPTLTVGTSGTPSVYGSLVYLTATISSGPTGNVTFYNNGNPIGIGTISGNTATLATSILAGGSNTITAAWPGNSNYNAVTSSSITQVVNPASQSISFEATTSPVPYGISPITLSATGGGSGNAVTFSVVSGPGTITGATLAVTGVGTVIVGANQSGNGNYTAAAQVTHSVVVNQGSQAISFTLPPVAYGFSPIDLSATGGGSGNAVTFSVLSGPGTTIGNTLTISGVGTVVVAANQSGNVNYAAATQVTQSITVNAVTPTISLATSSTPSTYGSLVTFTATISSGPSGAITFYNNGNPIGAGIISGSTATFATSILPGGSNAITAGWAGNSNYNAVISSATTQVVSQDSQAITFVAPASPVAYGVSPIALLATGGGSGNAVTFSIVSGPGAINGNMLTFKGVGAVVIAANQGGNGNYTAAPQVTQSVLTIQGAQVINFAAPPSPVAYGVSPVALSATGGGSGNSVTFSIVSGPGTISGNMLTITGVGTVVVAANQAGNGNYFAAEQVTQSFIVNQALQTISFTAPSSPVTYGVSPIALSAAGGGSGNPVIFSIVSGSGSINGSMLTITGAGTIVVAANQAGNTNYSAAVQVTQSVAVTAQTPIITWVAPSAITYGTALTSTQLNATAVVPGMFAYTPAEGAIPGAGLQTLSVTFTPTNTTNYNPATSTASLTVNKAAPAITWSTPSPITYGTALGSAQLNATANAGGTFVYTPASGTVPGAGLQTLSATFTPADTTDYNSAITLVNLTVEKATPAISWATPSAITYGTALSGTQLNASANVPGTFAYTPSSGAVPGTGTQALLAAFVPADTTDYSPATSTVDLTVNPKDPLAGTIYTVAGTGQQLWGCGSGQALSAAISPGYVAVDISGNVYFTSGPYYVCKVSASTGIISTVAGNGGGNDGGSKNGDGGLATNATFSTISGLAVDGSGNVYVIDGNRIREVTFTNGIGIITTVAGNGTAGYSGDGGPATKAELWAPAGIAVDSVGTIYISDGAINYRVRKVVSGIITTVAGNGTAGYSGDGGPATSANIIAGYIAVDSFGNIYFTDHYNLIRKVTAAGIITTVAGDGQTGSGGDGLLAIKAQLANTAPLAADTVGNIYSTGYGRIRKISASTGFISTVAGGLGTDTGDGELATNAEISPSGIAVDSKGNIYLTDSGARVRVVGSGLIAPPISWTTPDPIAYGTLLSSLQLNATSTVPGTFSYTPAPGTMLSGGTQTLAVTFIPNDTTIYSTSAATVSQIVTKASASVSIGCSPISTTYGSSDGSVGTTCIANTTGGTGTMTLTYDGGNPWTDGDVDASGNFSVSGGFWGSPAGTHTVIATYSGDSNYNGGQASTTYTINKTSTITLLNSSLEPSNYHQSVTFQAMTSSGGGTSGGTVTFYDGSENIGTGSVTSTATTNLLPNSQQFTTPPWGGYCATPSNLTPNAVGAPDGSITATQFVMGSSFTCGSGVSWGAIDVISGGLKSGSVYTASIWLRGAVNGETVAFGLNDSYMTSVVLGTSWQRYFYTFPAYVSGNEDGRGFQLFSTSPNATFYAWGAQLEQSPSVGPYVMTGATPRSGVGGVATLTTNSLYVGQHAIAASYSGDANDIASSSAAISQVVIGNLAQTLTWATPAAITYGTSLSSAQLNAVSNADGNTVYSPLVGTVLPSGTQTLSVVFTPTDLTVYDPARTSVPLIVNKALLTVTANPITMTYGGGVPPLTYSVSGFVNGDTSAVLTGAPLLSTTATTWSPAGGTYPITVAAGSLGAANYTFSFVNGILTVPSVIISSLSQTSGPVGTIVSISGSGFGNEQDASTVTVSGVPAFVTFWKDASITFVIPQGAVTGPVQVNVGAGSNTVMFTVTATNACIIADGRRSDTVRTTLQVGMP